MGRVRGKGKKLTISNDEDPIISGEDEKVPKQKRRGRPQKLFKDEFDEEEEIEEIEEDDDASASGDNVKSVVSGKEMKNPNTRKHGRKRKRNLQENKTEEALIDEDKKMNGVVINGSKNKSSDELTLSTNGYRHNGSRRKSKPRRAAEAGVLCKQDYA